MVYEYWICNIRETIFELWSCVSISASVILNDGAFNQVKAINSPLHTNFPVQIMPFRNRIMNKISIFGILNDRKCHIHIYSCATNVHCQPIDKTRKQKWIENYIQISIKSVNVFYMLHRTVSMCAIYSFMQHIKEVTCPHSLVPVLSVDNGQYVHIFEWKHECRISLVC